MSVGRKVAKQVGPMLAPKIAGLAPGLTSGFVREALRRAIEGAGPLAPAGRAADKLLRSHDGDVQRTVETFIDNHVRYAGAQGFVTNLGGAVTMTVAVPANITGLAVLQCRMVAGVAHLRGYDLDDPRVRNAVLVTILGEETVSRLVEQQKLPAPPMALATAPVHDAGIDDAISAEVATDLITRVAGKRMATQIGRRVPVVGGLVGMGTDGYVTWKIGGYADRELRRRPRR